MLEGLSEKGFNKEVLVEMQRIVNAENSDLFDLLAHVAFALQPVTSSNRATNAKNEIENHFADKQTAFIDFVLGIYIKQGADEFRQEKLKDLID